MREPAVVPLSLTLRYYNREAKMEMVPAETFGSLLSRYVAKHGPHGMTAAQLWLADPDGDELCAGTTLADAGLENDDMIDVAAK